jgi:hypothetical protein
MQNGTMAEIGNLQNRLLSGPLLSCRKLEVVVRIRLRRFGKECGDNRRISLALPQPMFDPNVSKDALVGEKRE